jgi:hypothetical protein
MFACAPGIDESPLSNDVFFNGLLDVVHEGGDSSERGWSHKEKGPACKAGYRVFWKSEASKLRQCDQSSSKPAVAGKLPHSQK